MQMVEFVHKSIKIVVLTVLPMFEMLEERLKVWGRDMEVIKKKKIHIKLLDISNVMFEMENAVDGFNNIR